MSALVVNGLCLAARLRRVLRKQLFQQGLVEIDGGLTVKKKTSKLRSSTDKFRER